MKHIITLILIIFLTSGIRSQDSLRTEIIRNPKGAERVTYKYDSQGNQTMAIIERIDIDPEAIRLKVAQLVQEHEYQAKLIEQYQEEIRKLRKQQRETQQEAQELGKLLRTDKIPKQ